MHCPNCLSPKIKKNGSTYYGRQNHKCKVCGRQFVFPNYHNISESGKELIRKALLERVSLRVITRIFKVSLTWLLEFMLTVYEEVPDDLGIDKKICWMMTCKWLLFNRMRPGRPWAPKTINAGFGWLMKLPLSR